MISQVKFREILERSKVLVFAQMKQYVALGKELPGFPSPDCFAAKADFPNTYYLNCGWCRDFAMAVCKAVNGTYYQELLARTQGPGAGKILYVQDNNCECQCFDLDAEGKFVHMAILWNDMWYDAECFDGVDSPEKLPFFNR